MERRITVIGKGRVRVKPDYIEITMRLETKDKLYHKAMSKAVDRIGSLTDTLSSVGFSEDDIRTSDFSVAAMSDYKNGLVGGRKQVDTGFKVMQKVRIGFDLDMERLSRVIAAISKWSGSDPDLSVEFTAKDPSAVQDLVLRSAAESARHQAETLCAASGVTLGDLVSVNYSWTEVRFRSNTVYHDSKTVTRDPSSYSMDTHTFAKMRPDDIDARDSATFVWAIE